MSEPIPEFANVKKEGGILMLYHVSSTHGIKILKPQESTHGKKYVYAIKNMVTGLLFGVKKDDFDFIICTDDNGTPEVYECYPHAFELKYKHQSCSVYQLDEKGFLEGQTGWDAELVCESPVTVQKETIIPDIYQRLLAEIETGNLILHKYSDTMEYKSIISEHIVDRLIRFDLLNRMESDERFHTYYDNIVKGLKELISGKYL